LDGFDTVRIKNPLDHEIRGVLALMIFWSSLLTDVLAPGSNGILIVFENECNPTFTFRVNGPEVEFLGRNDLHDTKYDSKEKSVSILDGSCTMMDLVLTLTSVWNKTNRLGCWS
jgi:hypothetical protein